MDLQVLEIRGKKDRYNVSFQHTRTGGLLQPPEDLHLSHHINHA